MSSRVVKTSGFVSVGTSSTVILPDNVARRSVTITNDGANLVYLMFATAFGSVPTAVLGSGMRLAASGGTVTLEGYSGTIYGIAATGATNVTVFEN